MRKALKGCYKEKEKLLQATSKEEGTSCGSFFVDI